MVALVDSQCFPGSILARMGRAALEKLTWRDLSRRCCVAKPPSELPCFIGTSLQQIAPMARPARPGPTSNEGGGWPSPPAARPPRAARHSAAIGVARFEFFFFEFRSADRLEQRRMSVCGAGWRGRPLG